MDHRRVRPGVRARAAPLGGCRPGGRRDRRRRRPLLTARIDHRRPKDPIRVILDTHLRMAPTARVLNHASPADTLVVAGRGAPDDAKRRIARKGCR